MRGLRQRTMAWAKSKTTCHLCSGANAFIACRATHSSLCHADHSALSPITVDQSDTSLAGSVVNWGMATVFEKLYFMRHVPNCLPPGPLPHPLSSPLLKVRAKLCGNMAAKPAAGEPIPAATIKHVGQGHIYYPEHVTCGTQSHMRNVPEHTSPRLTVFLCTGEETINERREIGRMRAK